MTDEGASARALRRLVPVVFSVLAVAFGARASFELPGAAAPQSAQTLMVILSGAWAGPIGGTAAMILYVVVGALGVPVFADGNAGLDTALGPSAGYLAGFVLAALGMGLVHRHAASLEGRRRVVVLLGAAVCAHAVILGCGWLRLAALLGWGAAAVSGVVPFLLGGAVKSLVAAVLLEVQLRVNTRSR